MVKYDDKNHWLTFSSGRQEYVHNGMIGLRDAPDCPKGFDLGYGSDGPIFYDTDYVAALTKAESMELADHMIDMWQRFKASL